MNKLTALLEQVWSGDTEKSSDILHFDFNKNLTVLLQPVGKMYIVGAILANWHTCLYGSQTGHFFDLDPPSLETYLNNQ